MNLNDLVYPDDGTYIKTVLSAGDLFPGFYRYTLSPRFVRGNQLEFHDLLRYQANPEQTYTRDEWLSETMNYYKDIEIRDLMHSDVAIYRAMRANYRRWIQDAKEYGVLCIDIQSEQTRLEFDQSYFFMGGIVRLTPTHFELGVDHYYQDNYSITPCDGESILTWLNDIYRDTHRQLFLPARVVGELCFTLEDRGHMGLREEPLFDCMMFNDPVVFGCNNTISRRLPIRWAKDIVLTGVGR